MTDPELVPAVEAPAGRPFSLGGALIDAVAIVVAWNLAVAQPLLDLLGRNAEFFIARSSEKIDIYVLAVGLTLVAPLVIAAAVVAIGTVHRLAGRVLLGVVLAALVGMLGLRIVKEFGEPGTFTAFLIAAALGVAFATLFLRVEGMRAYVRFLSPAPVLFVVMFLFFSPVADVLFPEGVAAVSGATVGTPVPVVMIVFDELAMSSLMDEDGTIDEAAFPNFARLVASSTWFRNTVSVHNQTTRAVPIVLTGLEPKPGLLPVLQDYPRNVFTLLGGAYEIRAIESVTHLCPESLCASTTHVPDFESRMRSLASDLWVVYRHQVLPRALEEDLPAIDRNWGGFANAGDETSARDIAANEASLLEQERAIVEQGAEQDRAAAFTALIANAARAPVSSKPTFTFLHELLPHTPWQYLPDGTQYQGAGTVFGLEAERWDDDPAVTEQGFQRHLLQLQYTDRRLGELLDTLQQQGRYDESLIVVTADHGVAFEPGNSRRDSDADNVEAIAPVPFFVKTPAQREGVIDDRPLETVDVLPTIADLLDVESAYDFDGRSAFDDDVAPRHDRKIVDKDFDSVVFPDGTEPLMSVVSRKWDLFPAGGDGPVGFFALGDTGGLVGSPVDGFVADPEPTLRFRLESPERYAKVDRSTGAVPSLVVGRVEQDGDPPQEPIPLAVAVDGVVVGVTQTFRYVEGGERFAALVLPDAFHDGANTVKVFAIVGEQGTFSLHAVGAME